MPIGGHLTNSIIQRVENLIGYQDWADIRHAANAKVVAKDIAEGIYQMVMGASILLDVGLAAKVVYDVVKLRRAVRTVISDPR